MLELLLLTHFIGDFLLQSDWMALNKSKRLDALFVHATTYAVCFLWVGPTFALITLVTHMATDAITSRITSRLWFFDSKPEVTDIHGVKWMPVRLNGKRHWFFVMIGFDQLIHAVTLIWTLKLLIP